MKTISILSGILIVIPFLGIPASWKTFLVVLFAGFIFIKSFYSHRTDQTKSAKENETFRQNGMSDTQVNLLVSSEKKSLEEDNSDRRQEDVMSYPEQEESNFEKNE